MDKFYYMAKKMIKLGEHSLVFYSAPQFSTGWKRPEPLSKEKDVVNDGERETFKTREEEVFRVEQMRLFYTTALSHYYQNWRSQGLKRTDVLKHAIHFC